VRRCGTYAAKAGVAAPRHAPDCTTLSMALEYTSNICCSLDTTWVRPVESSSCLRFAVLCRPLGVASVSRVESSNVTSKNPLAPASLHSLAANSDWMCAPMAALSTGRTEAAAAAAATSALACSAASPRSTFSMVWLLGCRSFQPSCLLCDQEDAAASGSNREQYCSKSSSASADDDQLSELECACCMSRKPMPGAAAMMLCCV
jgi:hypothetical protein